MSDTPLDADLGPRWSTRAPEWMEARVERFREEYNELVEIRLSDAEAAERFRLESASEARRRLLDIGLWAWFSNHRPHGFGFEATAALSCPACATADPPLLRIGATDRTDPDAPFDVIRCTACGHTDDRAAYVNADAWEFDGVDTETPIQND